MSQDKTSGQGRIFHFETQAETPMPAGLAGSTSSEVTKSSWSRDALQQASSDAQSLVHASQKKLDTIYGEPAFVGSSRPMRSVFDIIDRVANTDSTVLILGESGTGKELVARAIHNQSDRADKPFVAVNCGAIPAELLESELFGHVKGAFTGAHMNRIGRFSLAHQGTLFLDEIGTMPLPLQVKILRALQEKEFEPVGGNKSQKVDCRVIAATNNDLEQEVAKGAFREDLFYRLNVIPITLPPLRDRREDIPQLVQYFIGQYNKKKGFQIRGISEEAMEALEKYHWPGNVRELENICQRLCILKTTGLLELADIPPKVMHAKPSYSGTLPWAQWLAAGIPESGIDFDRFVEQFENDMILRALEQTRWNKNQAAALLRMNRTTLVEKIKKRGLQQV